MANGIVRKETHKPICEDWLQYYLTYVNKENQIIENNIKYCLISFM